MAGLCAARVLADRFDHVTVVDRDSLPDAPDLAQPGAPGPPPPPPAGRGARLLEGWFPGIIDELYAGGAVEIDLAADMHWYQGGGVARRPPSSLRGPSMSRPFLEWTVRTRLAALPNVTILGDTTVTGLELDATGRRVVAARLADGHLPCDLVVDASGRHAHSLPWLEQLGYPSPDVSRVEIDTRYVTQQLRRSRRPGARLEGGRCHRRPGDQAPRHGPSHRGRPLARPVRRCSRRDRSRRPRRTTRLRPQPPLPGHRRPPRSLRPARRADDPPIPLQPAPPRRTPEAVPARLGAPRRRHRLVQPDLRPGHDRRRPAGRPPSATRSTAADESTARSPAATSRPPAAS